MKLRYQGKIYSLSNRSKLLTIVFLWVFPFVAQAQYHLTFKNLSDQEVIKKLESSVGVTINYNHSIFTKENHSFSVSGSKIEVLSNVGAKLGFEFIPLEQNIYAINIQNSEVDYKQIEYKFKVLDNDDNVLPYCNISVPNLDLFFQTDINGDALISGYFSDKEIFHFSYVGYDSYYTTAKELKSKSSIKLENATHILGEIIITEFLSSVKSNEIENQENLQEIGLAGLSDQDLLQKAQLLPGIHSSSESLNDLQIRGGPPDQISYRWNEIRLLQTSLFYGKVSGVNPFIVDDISITRNGASADQSGQASGSIHLLSSEKVKDRFKFKFFTDLIYSNIGLDIPIIENKLSFNLAYRRSHNFLFDSQVYNAYFDQTFQFGQLVNDQFYIDLFGIRGQEQITKSFDFDDLSANFNWSPSKKFVVSGSFIDLSNQFQYDYFDGNFTDETKSDQLEISNLGYSLRAKYLILPKLELSGLYSGSKYENHFLFFRDVGSKLGEDRFKENDVNQHQFRLDLRFKHKVLDLDFGIQSENWEVGFIDTTRNASLGLSYIKDQLGTKEQSAFVKAKWKFIPKTVFETGIRYSDFGFSLVDRKFIEPRLHISHRLSNKFTIHAHFGKYHQNLNRRLFSTPLEVEKGIWYLSDERPESPNFIWVVQNTQSSLGFKYLISNWKFTLDAYNKKAENIWTSALDFSVEEDPFSFADLLIKGIEFSSHYQNKNWRLLWTYELTDETMNIKRDIDFEIKSPFTQRHRLSMMQSYRHQNFTFSTRWRYNSGRRYSEGKEFIIQTEPELYYGIQYESILESQVPAYHSLDASIEYKWKLNPSKNRFIEFGFHVQNLYNRENIIKRQYFIDYTKTPFELSFYDRVGLGFTPNFSVVFSGS